MKKKLTIYLNAPITLSFAAMCLIALALDYLTNGLSNDLVFSTYGSSFLNPLTYVRLIGHIFGHADFDHLLNNMLFILLLGPMLEEKYHDKLLVVIFSVAIVTGVIHNIFNPNVQLLGASGVVFAFILLASITGHTQGIPVTLIIIAILYIGGEIYDGIISIDNVSHITHIIGGVVGAVIGLRFK